MTRVVITGLRMNSSGMFMVISPGTQPRNS